MSESNNQKKSDENFIDLDKSQFKKKSNFLRNLIFFLSIFFITLSLGFFLNDYLKKNKIKIPFYNFYEPQNSNYDLKELNLLYDQQNEFTKEYQERLSLIENEIQTLSNDIENYVSQMLDIKKKMEDLNNQKIESNNITFNEVKETSINQDDLVLANLFLLKNSFSDRQSYEQPLEKLMKIFSQNQEIMYLLKYFQSLDITRLPKKTYFLNEINKKIYSQTEGFEEFIQRIELTDEFENIFDSKESFLIYLKQIFNSTFKISKISKPEIENDFSTKKQQHNILQVLIQSKEEILNDNLDKGIKLLNSIKAEENSELRYLIISGEEVIESKLKLYDLEKKIYFYLGNSFDQNY